MMEPRSKGRRRIPSSLFRVEGCCCLVTVLLVLLGLTTLLTSCRAEGESQHYDDLDKDISQILTGAEHVGNFLVELFNVVTGTGLYQEDADLKVEDWSVVDRSLLLQDTKDEMEAMMEKKVKAVEDLKEAAERAMNKYGPYRQDIDFEDVSYYNAKKVVVQSDIEDMSNETKDSITDTINYLPTEQVWPFSSGTNRPELNEQTSSIHVPTNIYDKSMKILNGVQWTKNLSDQFVSNLERDRMLTWQYFCSSDGFFRIYPGMQWPRDADKVDTFDCRIRQWYIQAATSPKNIIILLDTSGSMKGLRLSIAKSTVSTILDTLSYEDYFNVIKFSDEPEYVVDCFNGTLMPASMDNIKRVQAEVEDIKAQKYASFEKALTLAFNLFRKEKYQHNNRIICNKAIMLITDGAPENYDFIFKYYNWPEKEIRVFTFLIGKEVQDNRQARWMACANKGKFTHISTRADVQENVQKYIRVLSRPLAIKQARHQVWSPVYLDYVTEQSDIVTTPHTNKVQLEVDFEETFIFQGRGLVMSISMPVFDKRSKDRVGPMEEEPSRHLLGVVGADLRVNELIKLLPTFELGVNGYAFAITNHGYVLFHPEYKPFFIEQKSSLVKLKQRPKYNSVELSELERPAEESLNDHREHPLSHYVLQPMTGDTFFTIVTHFDDMKRVEKRSNIYKFREVSGMFRLVFVVPKGYGTKSLQIRAKEEQLLREAESLLNDDESLSALDFSSWIYCQSLDGEGYDQLRIMYRRNASNLFRILNNCDKKLAMHFLKDIVATTKYSKIWTGQQFNHRRPNGYIKVYDECYSSIHQPFDAQDKLKCFGIRHLRYGIRIIWIGTRSGITRSFTIIGKLKPEIRETIKSEYYQRTVSLWDAGYKYIFTGPTITSKKEQRLDLDNAEVTLSHAELVGNLPNMQVPAAVMAFSMNYSSFFEVFVNHTFECPENDGDCPYTCNNTANFNCYIVDNDGYILATNSPGKNGTGLFLGEQNGYLMRALVDEHIFTEIQLTDHQSICISREVSGQDNASNYIFSPLQIISKFFVWLLTEFVILLSHLTVMTWHGLSGVMGLDDNLVVEGEETECGQWIPESLVRYIFCGFVINRATGANFRVNFVTKMRSCEQRVIRYNLNLEALRHREVMTSLPSCHRQCHDNQPFFQVRRMNESNLIFLVSDASCQCAEPSDETDHDSDIEEGEEEEEETTTIGAGGGGGGTKEGSKKRKDRYHFSTLPEEMIYEETEQCQRLRNLSAELKRVDNTRNNETPCHDSSKEKDTTCSQAPPLTIGLEVCVGFGVLSALQALWTQFGSNQQ